VNEPPTVPRSPNSVQRWVTGHSFAVDATVAAVYVLGALGSTVSVSTTATAVVRAEPVEVVVAGVILLFRRRFPVVALALIGILFAVSVWSGVPAQLVALAIALYSVSVFRSSKAGWIALAACEGTLAGVIGTTWAIHPSGVGIVQPVFGAVLALIAVLVGTTVGTRRRFIDALTDRAVHLERERDQQHALATAAERSRIAREMHDIVSHSLTVMVTLADGSVAQLQSDPVRAAGAITQIADTGRRALTDMRRMLGLLNYNEPELPFAPAPNVDDLLPLVEQMREAGLPIAVSLPDNFPDDTALQLTVYRIVQECLTNILRHAPHTSGVSLTLFQSDSTFTIDVSNEAGSTAHNPTRGSGGGIPGIRSRVALYGGTLRSAATPEGGWRSVATLQCDPLSSESGRL